eukprot:TRINITY_DN6222_c1_g3_i2.p1 TRINITY_DN6222_c1_g3~~TRINITY_DN6222_c1_g3_i2.p1  ORF type:complete len:286 (+),score=18.80 TRINITY_DN6222_c1_g3_i2:122-859(+)
MESLQKNLQARLNARPAPTADAIGSPGGLRRREPEMVPAPTADAIGPPGGLRRREPEMLPADAIGSPGGLRRREPEMVARTPLSEATLSRQSSLQNTPSASFPVARPAVAAPRARPYNDGYSSSLPFAPPALSSARSFDRYSASAAGESLDGVSVTDKVAEVERRLFERRRDFSPTASVRSGVTIKSPTRTCSKEIEPQMSSKDVGFDDDASLDEERISLKPCWVPLCAVGERDGAEDDVEASHR